MPSIGQKQFLPGPCQFQFAPATQAEPEPDVTFVLVAPKARGGPRRLLVHDKKIQGARLFVVIRRRVRLPSRGPSEQSESPSPHVSRDRDRALWQLESARFSRGNRADGTRLAIDEPCP